MTYKVEFTNRSKPPIFVKDNEYNYQTSITMFGQNTTDYGQVLWSNILQYLEHWNSVSPPIHATEGQIWFDAGSNSLKINTSKYYDQPEWTTIAIKPEFNPNALLQRTGGTLTYDLTLTGPIINPDQFATKKYVDDNKNVLFESANSRYQHNIMIFNGFMTLNGVIQQNEFVDNVFHVELPKPMKDVNYTAMLTVGSKKTITAADNNGDPMGHHYYITNKTTTGFDVNIDAFLPTDGEIQLTVVGFTVPPYKG